MKRLFAIGLFVVLVLVTGVGGAIAAPAGTPGVKGPGQDPACVISPNPAAVDQLYWISAKGLPTANPVWLIATPPSGSGTVSQVAVNADGTALVGARGSVKGTWAYTFSGVQTNGRYGAVAKCAVQVK